MSDDTRSQMTEGERELARKLDAGGWGVFFIWLGISVFTSLGWGITLLGIGAITIGGQLIRKYSGLPLEGFWLVVGILFTLGGLWTALEAGRPKLAGVFVPLVCIVAGATLLMSALFRRREHPPVH